jgi:hypothetical protein
MGEGKGRCMPVVQYFLLARDILIDQITGDLSVIGILEDIRIASLPAVLPKIVAVAAWQLGEGANDGEYRDEVRVRLGDRQLPTAQPSEPWASLGPRVHSLWTLKNVQLDSEEDLVVELLLNGKPQAEFRIPIRVLDAADPADADTSGASYG